MLEPTTLQEAAEKFSGANDSLVEAYAFFFEKIALYSAGVISLSITFIGYLLSKDPSVLLQRIWEIPLYLVVFIGWGLLFATLLLGIYLRVFAAKHRSRMTHAKWIKLFGEDRHQILAAIKTGEATVDVALDKLPNWIENAEKTVDLYRNLAVSAEKGVQMYDLVSPYIRKTTIAFFILGNLCVLAFSALSILKIAETARMTF